MEKDQKSRKEEASMRSKIPLIYVVMGTIFSLIIIAGGSFLVMQFISTSQNSQKHSNPDDRTTDLKQTSIQAQQEPTETPTKNPIDIESVLSKSNRLASGYDYDQAIQTIKSIENYDEFEGLITAINKYKNKKKKLVKWEDNSKIPHIFFHTLIVDTSKAFDGDQRQDGYNQVMTTLDEFKKIIEQMYDRGYVLVSIYDIARMEKQEDGTEKMVQGEIWLPKGKKPFVLSQDDVSYYTYMEGDGFADCLVVGENGKVTNEMTQEDGTVVRGSYDVAPVLEDFIAEHPDFSYRGARGILAITGYNGVLGYRTCPSDEATTDIETAKQEAKKVADALKEQGWKFASHSWGHRGMNSQEISMFKKHVDQWEEEVASILGETDILIYPFGEDISDWREYSGERYRYLKEHGFNYFCNVDGSAPYWLQFNDAYLRQGRINLDGIRMYEDLQGKGRLSTFFDVGSVFDKSRPLPVPSM